MKSQELSSRASEASVGIYCPSSVASHGARMMDPDTRSLRSLLRDDSSDVRLSRMQTMRT
jgi:hypothetical protein